MLHDAQKFIGSNSPSIAEPSRIRNLFRGYQREKISAALFFFAFGAISASLPLFGDATQGQKFSFLAAGTFCILVGLALIALRQTDPVTYFLKDPDAFVVCPATITQALYVAGNHKGTPPSVRAFASYQPEGGSPLVLETRFILGSWPFAYEKNGEQLIVNEKSGEVCRALPVNGWVVCRKDKPQVSFLAGIE